MKTERTHVKITQPNGHSFVLSYTGTLREVYVRLETSAARILSGSKFPNNTIIVPKEQIRS